MATAAIKQEEATLLVAQAQEAFPDDPEAQWKYLHESILTPAIPFATHRSCYEQIYQDAVVKPLWFPSSTTLATTNTARFQREMLSRQSSCYADLYQYSIDSRDDFWMQAQQAVGIQWSTPPTQAFASRSSYFPGGRLNIVDSCLQDDSAIAICFANDSDPTNIQHWTTAELRSRVQQVAQQLSQLVVVDGSQTQPPRIAVCLPLTPEAIAVYLGIVQMGGVVVSIADSFSSTEIATRCQIAQAQMVITQDVIVRDGGGKVIPLYGRVVEALDSIVPAVKRSTGEEKKEDIGETVGSTSANMDGSKIPVVVLPAALHVGEYNLSREPSKTELHQSIQLRSIDQTWTQFLDGSSSETAHFESVLVDSMEPCNILFSSGTTGTPKAIVWSHTTPIKCAVDGYFHQNLGPKDVVCWPTSLGWMMGSWLISQRILGSTIALYQGLPHTTHFATFVATAGVTMLGVIPSLVQTWMDRNTPQADWSRISRFSSTGEASDPRVYHWLMSRVPGYAPVIEYCGGTEIGGSFLSSVMDLPNVPSHFNTPVLGSDLRLMQEDGHVLEESRYGQPNNTSAVESAVRGELVLLPPSIGWSTTLLNRDHDTCYYGGMPTYEGTELRRHGDEFELVGGGRYFRALGRCDDAMNLGGIKVSSVELERVCNTVVCETAAIAIGQPSKLVVYAVLAADDARRQLDASDRTTVLRTAMQKAIKQQLNPLFMIRDVVVLEKLPRTASNKVMRRLLRDDYVQRMEKKDSSLCQ